MGISDIPLSHYTAEQFVWDEARTYPGGEDQPWMMKPSGLWVSVDGEFGWPEWCRQQEWGVDRLTHRTQVQLAPTANVLLISGRGELDAFTERYRTIAGLGSSFLIDWAGVKRDHDGLIITPYQWSARLDTDCLWYYGWDCASGCVWNLAAVAGVYPLTE